MEWKELAPWIAIALTLILSILVPLFTQIANNKFQLQLKEQEIRRIERERKLLAFEDFFKYAGGCVMHASHDNHADAGASIQRLHMYLPEEHWEDLEILFDAIRKKDWNAAEYYLSKLSKIISEESKKN